MWGPTIAMLSLLVTLCGLCAKGVWHLSKMSSEIQAIRAKVETIDKVAERVGVLERRADVIEDRVVGRRDRSKEVMTVNLE